MKYTLETGINGSGHKVWIVISSNNFAHYFDTEAEALNWMTWA